MLDEAPGEVSGLVTEPVQYVAAQLSHQPRNPDQRSSPPEVTLRESVSSTLADLPDLARQLPGGEPSHHARVLDRLAEELAEAAAMLRALPGRPVEVPGHECAMLLALRTAHAADKDVNQTIAHAVARLDTEQMTP